MAKHEMNSTITVRIRRVYGEDKVYPADDQSTRLAKLAGTKTLTPGALNVIREMGFTINYVGLSAYVTRYAETTSRQG